MSKPLFLRQPTILRIPQLLTELFGGHMRIPRFQRGFEWSDDQRIRLLDSIYQGIPIGSLMVWRTKKPVQSETVLGPYLLPEDATVQSDSDATDYTLDGQQRLTTLFAALSGWMFDDESAARSEGGKLRKDVQPRNWPIVFDLRTEAFSLERRQDKSGITIPLSIILDPFAVSQFLRKNVLEEPDARTLFNRADHLAGILKDYAIPVVPIVTDEISQATLCFKRLNSGGTRMDEVNMVRALTWSHKFDLLHQFVRIREFIDLPNWESIPDQLILNTAKAMLGVDIYDAEEEAFSKKIADNQKLLSRVRAGLLRAVRFLGEECSIHGLATLPSDKQLLLLSVVLQGTPDEDGRHALRDWFWRTTSLGTFTGMTYSGIRAQQACLERLLGGDTAPIPPTGGEVGETRHFSVGGSTRAISLAIRMAELGPMLDDGTPVASPCELLGSLGQKAMQTFLKSDELSGEAWQNVVWLPENRFLVPPLAWRRFHEILRKAPKTLPEVVCRSHAISAEARDALVARDYELFLLKRRQTLRALESKFVESLGLTYLPASI